MPNSGNLAAPSTVNPEAAALDEDINYAPTNLTLKHMEQMLTEEDSTENSRSTDNFHALQVMENSFYELLSKKPAPSPHQHLLSVRNPLLDFSRSCSSNAVVSSVEPSGSPSSNCPVDFSSVTPFAPNRDLGESLCVLQFRRGLDEASKFLPRVNLPNIGLEKNKTLPMLSRDDALDLARGLGKDERGHLPNSRRRRKNCWFLLEEDRSKKQLAPYDGEEVLSRLFDRLFVNPKVQKLSLNRIDDLILLDLNSARKRLPQNKQAAGSGESSWAENWRDNNMDRVDLESHLLSCARAVAAGDRNTICEVLKHIRQHTSPFGSGTQRCAHYLSHAIEARWAGTGPELCTALDSKLKTALDLMKAYETLALVCPFRRIGFYFSAQHLLNLAEKASKLHIIDFGILNGFRWIDVIQYLSARPGGPPRLRITGIEDPQPGFRPAEMVEKAGHILARYCKRFNVPFEYNGIISQSWHTIPIEDLKTDQSEAIAVFCAIRLEKLLDDRENSPRDVVLNLIRKINPNIFIHSTVNGSCSGPFFFTRFQGLLYHHLAWFDMLDTNFTRENPERIMIERYYLGRSALNILAFEGPERVERPETYKQWQQRIARSGFRQLPLDRELLRAMRTMLKAEYHKEFVLSEDGHWLLQGWRGRILFALCCWAPLQQP